MIIIDLLYNLSVLVALSLLSGFVDARFNRKTLTGQILQGVLFGTTAIIGMIYPFVMTEGIIFDGRSIVISISTLFFGPVTGVISSVMAIIYRIILGGGGVLTGTLVITASFAIGYWFYRIKQKALNAIIRTGQLYFMGVLVHIVMLALMLFLPAKNIMQAFKLISITVIGVYPLVTLLIGKILMDQERSKLALKKLKENEEKYRGLFEANHDGIAVFYLKDNNSIGELIEINDSLLQMLGFNRSDVPILNIELVENNTPAEEREERLQKLILNGFTGFETTLRHKDGHYISADVQVKLFEYNNRLAVMNSIRDISEKKNAEHKLKESEERFRRLAENAQDLIYRYEIIPKQRFTYASPSSLSITGYLPEELYSNPELPLAMLHPEDKIKFTSLINDPGKIKNAIELRWIKKDGTPIWTEQKNIPVYNEQHRMIAIEGIVRDITEQKNAEFELANSEMNFRNLFDTMEHMIIIARLNGEIIYTNKAVTAKTGYQKEELLKMNIISLNPSDKIEESKKIVAEMLAGNTNKCPLPIQKQDGSLLPAETFVWFGKWDKQDCILGVTIDLTKQEEALQFFSEVFDTHPALMALSSFETKKFIMVNQTFLDTLGYDRTEIIGFRSEEIQIAFNQEEHVKLTQKMIKQGYLTNEELQIRTKKGDKLDGLFSGKIIESQGKKYFLTVMTDITIQKKAENALLANEKFATIAQTASAIAHDFNNSLQAIYGNIELLLAGKSVPEHVSSKLNVIKGIAEDAAERVQTLQKYSGSNRVVDSKSVIDLNEVLRDVIEQTRALWKDNAEKMGISIKVSHDPGKDIFTSGNISTLRSAFFNLIKNSVEALPSGGEINIVSSREGDNIILLFSDTGIGMNEEVKARAFLPFFTTKGFEVGLGVGLSGVYSIINDHGGKIYIKETGTGKGTTFEIILPYQPPTDYEKPVINNSPSSKRVKILWVDDDISIREVAEEMLEMLECDGTIVEDGLKALDLLAHEEYDLIVTDIGMPKMNGWQLADEIQARFPDKYKIAVLSGWGSEISQEKMKSHNVSFILPKPFKMNQLNELIKNGLTQ